MKTVDSDSLHRLVKLDLDNGSAATLDEALQRFKGYRLGVIVGKSAAEDPVQQVALLTAVNAAKRSFLGGVAVCGPLNAKLVIPLPLGGTLESAVRTLGGECVERIESDVPVIHIGRPTSTADHPFAVSTTYQGWRGGVCPSNASNRLAEQWGITPAGALAGALAVNEAFRFVRGDGAAVGRRPINYSLWSTESDGIPLTALPTDLWIGGLGHLGQAYLWILATLPYSGAAAKVNLVLQDFDRISNSSISTSMLTNPVHQGQRKTRVVANWLERVGFHTTLSERRFDTTVRIDKNEPRLMIACFDNAAARRVLEGPGFDAIVEAGLGADASSFQAIRLHTFPGPKKAATLWARDQNSEKSLEDKPAYREFRRQGMDACGVTLLAEKAVGAPFVGCVAAAFMVAETLKLLMGGPVRSVLDVNLRAPKHLESCTNRIVEPRNPGYVPIAAVAGRVKRTG